MLAGLDRLGRKWLDIPERVSGHDSVDVHLEVIDKLFLSLVRFLRVLELLEILHDV